MAHIPPPEMIRHLDETSLRFERLTEQISQPDVIRNREQYAKLSKERADLEAVVRAYAEYKRKLTDYEGARSILTTESDAEFRSLASREVGELEPQLDQEADTLQILLLPKDPNDEKNVVIELRAGVGGDEAGLFAGELFRAYQKYAESKRWRVELLSIAENSAGGYKEVIASIEGDRVYSSLKYESGVHRVQRVPKTEAQGRVHTSTITLAIMPEAEEVDIQIEQKDLRIDVFRAGGHGGQSVNTTDSAVRITYLPTNEVVICQDEKSQLKNKNKAMKVLRSRLYEKAQAAQNAVMSEQRRAQVGTGLRNERIRTYNFPQGRVTDHRIGFTVYNIDEVMEGGFEPFVREVTNYYQTLALKGEAAVKVVAVEED
jgi:peptide chain release factor 1